MARKVIRNTVFNSVGRIWTMVFAFLLTPFVVEHLGEERYGIWALVFVIVGYFGTFDFGIGVSFTKYVAQYHAQHNHKAVNALATSGLGFYLVLSTALIAGTAAFSSQILGLFHMPATMLEEARFVLSVAVLSLCLSNVANIFEAIINGLQHMEVTNLITLVVSVPQVIGTILVLNLGYGLRGLIFIRVFVVGSSLVLLAIWAYRLLPSLRLRPQAFRSDRLRQLLQYGAPIQITTLGALINLHVNKAFLGYFLGLRFITFYDLGFKVVYTVVSLPLLLVSAILPAASELDARLDKVLLDQIYTRGSKYIVLTAAPLAVFVILNAPRLMSTWMGAEYPESVQVVRILSGSFFINLLTAPGTSVARGIGRPWYEAQYAILTGLIHIGLALILIPTWGFIGALVAAFLGTTVGSAYFLYLFHRHMEKSFARFAAQIYLKPIVACAVAGVAVYLLNLAVDWPLPLPGRWNGLFYLTVSGAIFLGLYVIVIWWLDYLDSYDRTLIARGGHEAIFSRTSEV